MFDRNKKVDEIKSPCLIGTAGEFQDQVIQLLDKLSLGRHQKNDLCFPDHAVSAFHAEIVKVDNNYEIHDLGSKNRTRVNDRRIFKPTVLANNDLIKIGKNSFQFKRPAAETITVFATMPINDKRHKPKVYEDEDIVYTQKIPKHVFEKSKLINQDSPLDPITEKVALTKDKVKKPPKPNEGLPKPRKMLVNTISACLVLFIIILVMAKSLPQKPVGVGRTNIDKRSVGAIDETKRTEYIKEIWKDKENLPSSTRSDTQEAMALLDHAQELFVQIYSEQVSTNPEKLWLTYKECLRALSYTNTSTEHTKIRTQCQHLRKALQIVMEDQENHYYVLYFKNNVRANWDKALDAIECNVQLLNLKGDNQKSKLAKMYHRLKFDIEQNKPRKK